MWLSQRLVDLLAISRDSVTDLKARAEILEAENKILREQLQYTRITSDWMRMRLNTLELERAGLLEKAYDIRLPAPEIVRTNRDLQPGSFNLENIFDSLPFEDQS